MGTNRHRETQRQTHILTKGMQQQQQKYKSKGTAKVSRSGKSIEEMRKAVCEEDSRAKGTSQIDTEKLMRNCKEGSEWDQDGKRMSE